MSTASASLMNWFQAKIIIKADKVMGKDLAPYKEYDMIVMPGGWTGVDNLMADERVIELVKHYHNSGKWIAAMPKFRSFLEIKIAGTATATDVSQI